MKKRSSSSSERSKAFEKAKKEYLYFDRLNGVKHCCEKCSKNVGIENLHIYHKLGKTGSSLNQYREIESNYKNKKTFIALCKDCLKSIKRKTKS